MQVLIVEDEQAAARRLEKMLLETETDIQICASLDSVEAAVQWLSENEAPDLMLLDIHLADGSGFEIFDHIEAPCPVIFITAYDEYALQAFKVNAVDYLLKPVKHHELGAAIHKYKQLYGAADKRNAAAALDPLLDNLRNARPAYLRRLLVRLGASIKLVDINDVAYFYTKDKITFLVVKGSNKRYPADYPLDKLETMLDPTLFFRINRQFILNVNAIREMHAYSKSRVKIDLDPPTEQDIIVSTERSSAFKKWLVGERD